MKIECNGTNFLITKEEQTFSLKPSEFWELVRYGDTIDTKSEVEEYLDQLEGEINGVSPECFSEHIDEITEKVIADRIADENGDQIYDVLARVAGGMSKTSKTSAPRCQKCTNEFHCSRDKDFEGKCPNYQRDAPDGGSYN